MQHYTWIRMGGYLVADAERVERVGAPLSERRRALATKAKHETLRLSRSGYPLVLSWHSLQGAALDDERDNEHEY